jgi:hypothetical protein
MRQNNTIILISLAIIALSCNRPTSKQSENHSFELTNIQYLTNYDNNQKGIIYLDYTDAINEGFVLPSKSQTNNGYFNFTFTIKALEKNKLYYKIYYQNESYKFPEQDPNGSQTIHPLAHENFYGSWEDTKIGFKPIKSVSAGESVMIEDSFKIVGNPRNEQKYYFEGHNDRWKRNPRVGKYSAILVIVSEKSINEIPEYITYIDKENNKQFINPYYYFLYGDGSKNANISVFQTNNLITVKASPDLGKGIYVNEWEFKDSKNIESFYDCGCSSNDSMYNEAPVEQFIHYVDKSAKLYNIPIIRDVINEGYTKEEYNWNRTFTAKEELIGVLPQTAKNPCTSVISDATNHCIHIANPHSEYGKWKKENVGIITRHGFVYGKFTVKANLTELLNSDNVWNGITNAIWMIYQGGRGQETGWNLRRPCTKEGYMETYWGGRYDNRVEQVSYSEIDFEILKTVHYCPEDVYPPLYDNYEADQNDPTAWNTRQPEEIKKYDSDIAVCCTNWDMACWQPENFGTGCQEVSHNGNTYLAHRWEDVYRAITEKHMANDDELFGNDYYYFQIDWQPDKIIWRIGPEKDQLIEVGYMDETMTSIPNNQMLMIITQEFHNTHWWPGSPYEQNNIPFPKNDITGTIYEITIE